MANPRSSALPGSGPTAGPSTSARALPTSLPAPAVQATQPHRYLIKRRFIGPLPASFAYGSQVRKDGEFYDDLRERLFQEEDERSVRESNKSGHGAAIPTKMMTGTSIRSLKKLEVREDFAAPNKSSGLGGGLHRWVGGSFTIGQEFDKVIGENTPVKEPGTEEGPDRAVSQAHEAVNEGNNETDEDLDREEYPVEDPERSRAPSILSKREKFKRADTNTTTASFKTAQTQHSLLEADDHRSYGYHTADDEEPFSSAAASGFVTARDQSISSGRSSATESLDTTTRRMQQLETAITPSKSPADMAESRSLPGGRNRAGSGQNLLRTSTEETRNASDDREIDHQAGDLRSVSVRSGPGKLRSALKGLRDRGSQDTALQIGSPPGPIEPKRSKSVQFPDSANVQGRAVSKFGGTPSKKHSKGGKDSRSKDTSSFDEETSSEGDVPAHPFEVLARSGEDVEGTSAGVVQSAKHKKRKIKTIRGAEDHEVGSELQFEEQYEEEEEEGEDDEEMGPESIVMRDRYLIRLGRVRGQGFLGYDETTARRRPCYRIEPLKEFLVVYRKGRLELYQEWRVPFKEQLYRTKRLAFIILLNPKTTSLSTFSTEDQSFSICMNSNAIAAELAGAYGARTSRKILNRIKGSTQYQWVRKNKEDTFVFIFIGREKTRIQDLYWEMWNELDGELPPTIDIRSPGLQTTVRIPVPEEEYLGSNSAIRSLTRSKVLQQVTKSINSLSSFQDIIAQFREQTQEPPNLQLAWNFGGRLDWISPEEDKSVENKPRPWNVMIGYALSSSTRIQMQLEVRPARHLANSIKLSDGSQLTEPQGIEGYLHRIRLKSGISEPIYVSVYGGNIFTGSAHKANPPLPPLGSSLDANEADKSIFETFLQDQRARGTANISASVGFIDFRDIQEILSPGETMKDEVPVIMDETQFLIICRSGRKIKLQAEDPHFAKEWIKSLKDHKRYWPLKQRIDARQHSDASKLIDSSALASVSDDENRQATLMPAIWNWCCIDGCSPMTHSGRLYLKDGPSKQFRPYFIVLCDATIILFQIDRSPFHRQRKQYSLMDAYIYSGFIAESELTSQLQEDFWNGDARIYQDGLQCADDVQDCTFVIWLRKVDSRRKQLKRFAGARQAAAEADKHFTPLPLGRSSARSLIFRARSKLERDQWIWAIRQDMERQGRIHVERGRRVREHGLVQI